MECNQHQNWKLLLSLSYSELFNTVAAIMVYYGCMLFQMFTLSLHSGLHSGLQIYTRLQLLTIDYNCGYNSFNRKGPSYSSSYCLTVCLL